VRTLAPAEAPYGIAVDGTRVYWTGSSGGVVTVLDSVPLTGGSATELGNLAGGINPGAVTVNSANAYFLVTFATGGGGLFVVPLTGGVPEQLWSTTVDAPFGLVVDSTALYWTLDADAPNGAIFTRPLTGGMTATLASALNRPAGLAKSGTNLYWTSDAALPVGAIQSMPATGGTVMTLVTNLDSPRAITVDDAVYFTTQSEVMRVSK
jgi:hypothetical protein